MSKNPVFNYSEFALNGFRKAFPIFQGAEPEKLAKWLYETVSAFSGRDGRSLAGGGEDDILCLIAAAADIELEVCVAREIKDALRAKLRRAWLGNDYATIFYVACGFERNASMSVIDHFDIDWVDPQRIVEEIDNEDEIEVPEAVKKWVEVLTEATTSRSAIGNRTRKKQLRKPISRAVKSLLDGVQDEF